MKLRNMTPHAITLVVGAERVEIPPCGQLVRAIATSTVVDSLDCDGYSIPVVRTEYGRPEGVPEYEEGTINIVSSLALSAIKEYYPDRTDFAIPADSVRDDNGRIVGCRSLAI